MATGGIDRVESCPSLRVSSLLSPADGSAPTDEGATTVTPAGPPTPPMPPRAPPNMGSGATTEALLPLEGGDGKDVSAGAVGTMGDIAVTTGSTSDDPTANEDRAPPGGDEPGCAAEGMLAGWLAAAAAGAVAGEHRALGLSSSDEEAGKPASAGTSRERDGVRAKCWKGRAGDGGEDTPAAPLLVEPATAKPPRDGGEVWPPAAEMSATGGAWPLPLLLAVERAGAAASSELSERSDSSRRGGRCRGGLSSGPPGRSEAAVINVGGVSGGGAGSTTAAAADAEVEPEGDEVLDEGADEGGWRGLIIAGSEARRRGPSRGGPEDGMGESTAWSDRAAAAAGVSPVGIRGSRCDDMDETSRDAAAASPSGAAAAAAVEVHVVLRPSSTDEPGAGCATAGSVSGAGARPMVGGGAKVVAGPGRAAAGTGSVADEAGNSPDDVACTASRPGGGGACCCSCDEGGGAVGCGR